MNHSTNADVTRLLQEVSNNNRDAIDRLLPLIYNELHDLAHKQHRAFSDVETLNTTAIVHEAYLKLLGTEGQDWKNRNHFYGVAARAMRHILLDYVKARKSQKRGGGQPHVPFEDDLPISDEQADEILALNDALEQLEKTNPRQSRIVECRFFAGMSVEETASILGVSTATVKRDWQMAQVWLFRNMRNENQA